MYNTEKVTITITCYRAEKKGHLVASETRAREKEILRERIKIHAQTLGFHEVAFLEASSLTGERAYQEWLEEGRHGEMDYLRNHQALRVDPRVLEPGTRTVIALMISYYQKEDLLDGGLRIARYAHGEDYHKELWNRMRDLASFIHAETGVDVATRPAVDSAPLLERDLAAKAGLGWIGKNAMLIREGLGSFTFLSEILVDLDLSEEVQEAPDRCGSCSRCLDYCPTGAIIAPHVIDARRCISYLTIELRGPIPRRLRPLLGDYLFGCDICQDVCPWNRKAIPTEDRAFQTRESYKQLRPQELLFFDHDRYVEVFRGSAMKRAKLRGLKRNAAVVIGNVGAPEDVELLLRAFHQEEDSLVRGHLVWAIGRLLVEEEDRKSTLDALLAGESESYVQEELREALLGGLFDE